MTKEQAEALYPLVHSPGWAALMEYKRQQLNEIHGDMEWQRGDDYIMSQGKCKIIRELFTLKKSVVAFLDIK
jgi:hypothetical protein